MCLITFVFCENTWGMYARRARIRPPYNSEVAVATTIPAVAAFLADLASPAPAIPTVMRHQSLNLSNAQIATTQQSVGISDTLQLRQTRKPSTEAGLTVDFKVYNGLVHK